MELAGEDPYTCLESGEQGWFSYTLDSWCIEGIAEECELKEYDGIKDLGLENGTPVTVCGYQGLLNGTLRLETEERITRNNTAQGEETEFRVQDELPWPIGYGQVCPTISWGLKGMEVSLAGLLGLAGLVAVTLGF